MLAEQSVDAEDELTVRRVIASDGRSRGYLNGVSVPLQLLRDVGATHRRHSRAARIPVADAHQLRNASCSTISATTSSSPGSVREAHKVWIALVNRTVELEGKARDRESKLELLRFQVSELKALDLKEGEVAQLTEERTRHSNRGRLAEAAQAAVGLLYDSDDGNAHATASRALAGIKTLSSVDQRLAKVIPMVDEATIQIREAARELSRYLETLDIDPARQEEVERRLAAVEELSRKHRVPSAELAAPRCDARKRARRTRTAPTTISTRSRRARPKRSRPIASWRRSFPPRDRPRRARFPKTSPRACRHSAWPAAAFSSMSRQANGEPAAQGFDAVEFRVTANPGQPLRPLAKVASGGELARLSLAVQVACSAKDARCMVFDEVDSGVGGAVAEIVGRELKALGYSGQAICVTHLPQVASQGHHHLRVAKLTDGKTTRTTHLRTDHGRTRRRTGAHAGRHSKSPAKRANTRARCCSWRPIRIRKRAAASARPELRRARAPSAVSDC